MNTKDKGNLGEAKVLADLISKKLNVAQPFGDNLPFDLIAIDTNYFMYKVQVKYSTLKDGKITLRKQKWSSNTKRNYVSAYGDGEVDVYAIFCEDVDKVFYVPHKVTASAKTTFEIRIVPAKGKQLNNPNINDGNLFLNFPNEREI